MITLRNLAVSLPDCRQTTSAKGTGLALLLAGGFLLAGCEAETPDTAEAARPVRAMKVADVVQVAGRSFPGRARATQEVDLSFRIAGPLIALLVNVGDRVATGETVARIDPRDFEVNQRRAEAELQRVMVNRQRTKGDYDRALRIQKADPNAVAETTVARAREGYELAEADIIAYQASLDAASDEVSYTHLKVPFDGTIVATYVDNFEHVQPRQSIARLLDSTRIEFVFNLPETMISMVRQVENLRVRFDAFPALEMPAEIKEIGNEASTTTRTYPVTLIMDQPEGAEILPGMAGKVSGEHRGQAGEATVAIMIPLTSVYSPRSGDQSFVWVIDEAAGTVSQRPVELGRLDTGGVAVTAGLSAGEVIATAGVNFLREGQQVRPELD